MINNRNIIDYKIFDENDFWYLIGLFIAEGSLYFSRRGYAVEFSLGADERDFIDHLKSILLTYNISSNTHSGGQNCIKLRIYSKSLFYIVKKLCYDKKSKIIPKVENCEQALNITAGLIDGDGYIYPSGRNHYVTSELNIMLEVTKLLKTFFELDVKYRYSDGYRIDFYLELPLRNPKRIRQKERKWVRKKRLPMSQKLILGRDSNPGLPNL